MLLQTLRQWAGQQLAPRTLSKRRTKRTTFRPQLELLERREVPAVITVKNLLDEAPGAGSVTKGVATSLRAAIEYANSHAGADTINLVKGKVYQVTAGELVIDTALGEQLTIQGVGGIATVQSNGASRVFRVGSESGDADIAVFNRLKIQGGKAVASFSVPEIGPPNFGVGPSAGGGIYNFGTLTLNSSVVTGNTAQGSKFDLGPFSDSFDGQGGGIYNAKAAKLTLNSTVVSGNLAEGVDDSKYTDGQGGGVFNAGELTMTGSTVSGNTARGGNNAEGSGGAADGLGGGLYNDGSMSITNSTFSGNQAIGGNNVNGTINLGVGGDASGGGIYSPQGGTITNSTIAFNSATGGTGTSAGQGAGGGLAGNSAETVSVLNSIVGLNTASSFDRNVAGFWKSLGHNLVGELTKSDDPHGFDQAGDVTDATEEQVGLNPLGNYGGPTPTHSLKATSLAINGGDDSVFATLKTDQRGSPRKLGPHVDIGAFESPFGAGSRRWN